ncbi:dTDP-4-dehydrorhamnose reductase [Haematobacter genomosp. 1]|uniref:dTDP-4-dehydrorhamnose reductase n=1 Tax=Haematobacter genomosp. 1 TaxID=366618 RepID=A0A212A891_9RHOB|nr:dTDP-4-dehydrorhamnose reductase [Haematobacter genomosp. 1]
MVAGPAGSRGRWSAVGDQGVRLLVIGRTGQLATELQDRAGAALEITTLPRDKVDLTDPESAARAIREAEADAVINAAAYTAVDKAEAEEETARLVNAAAPAAMARAAAGRGLPFLHVSTDYVFAGDGTAAWKPDDPTGPLGVYGRTKLEGEEGVRDAGGTSAILRTSWVFSAHGANFVKTMLRLGRERERLTVVADQVGGPTPAADIADALIVMARGLIADPGKTGTYHFSGAPDVSWADFAREIFLQAGLKVDVADIPTSAYPTPARRPANSRLDCSSLTAGFGIPRPDWRQGLAAVLKQLET